MSASHWQIRAKCFTCGLHFIVCTDRPQAHGRRDLFCPECGEHRGAFAVWIAEVEGAIWQTVPGDAALLEAGLGDVPPRP